MQKHKFKKGMMVTNNVDLTSSNILSILSTGHIIPKGTEFVIEEVERKGFSNKYLLRHNVHTAVWIAERFDGQLITLIDGAYEKKGLTALIFNDIEKDKIHIETLVENLRDKERGLEILKDLEPGLYLFDIGFGTNETCLFHLKGFSSRGLRAQFMASDGAVSPPSFTQTGLHPHHITKAVRVRKEELPLYIGWKHKGIEFDKVLKGKK